MAVDVIVPEVGEVGMEVIFVGWLKQEGDTITEGDELFEVDTSKAVIAVEAFASGVLRSCRVTEGDSVQPHQVVATIADPGEPVEDVNASPSATEPAVHPEASPAFGVAQSERQDRLEFPHDSGSAGSHRATPRARRRATELGVDLSTVRPSRGDGLISVADVDAGAASLRRKSRAARVREATAARTTASWQHVPHFHLHYEADVTKLIDRWRPTSLLLRAMVRTLVAMPEMNIEWSDGGPRRRDEVAAGLLVDTDDGLLLPRLSGLDASLESDEVDAMVAAVVERARHGTVTGDDARPRSFTLSNLGMYPVRAFEGVIAVPDSMLLSAGRAATRPVWDGGEWVAREVIDLTLSLDHRVYDGADGGRLLDVLDDVLHDEETW